MVAFDFVLPFPTTTWQFILALIGFSIGDWFSQLDWIVQQREGFDEKSEVDKMLIKAYLDFFHHWQIGAILFFAYDLGSLTLWAYTINFHGLLFTMLRWIGVGIWIHDWRNWERIKDRLTAAFSGDPPEDPVV